MSYPSGSTTVGQVTTLRAVERVATQVIDTSSVQEIRLSWLFDEVYQREYPGLVAVATALTGDRDSAPDLVQDTMLKAFLNWDRISVLERPGGWCHHVLVNACRSKLRRRMTERRYLAGLRRREPGTPGPSTETVAFWIAVRTLPMRPRTVVALYFGAELTSPQIAGVLGIPEGTVRSDIAAARRVVTRALEGNHHV